ncbi:MAG: hypothetical protein ACOYLT_11190, partial [Flavobacterium sp.]|uniref:hypothetical protein n=1 Tax=Flavobacterium sp. TaxID=239 RepID=UPI003BC2C214
YLFSYRPFSINGGSIHSNGIASVTDDKKAKKFFTENEIGINEKLPIIRGSLQSHIGEAILQAKSKNLLTGYKLNYNRVHYNIYKELLILPTTLKREGFEKLLSLNLSNKNYRLVESAFINDLSDGSNFQTAQDVFFKNNKDVNGTLNFSAMEYAIFNSFEACKFMGTILGPYQTPEKIKKVNYFSLAILFVRRFLSSKFNRYYLPER